MSETLDLVKMLISFRKLNGVDVAAKLWHLGVGTRGGGITMTTGLRGVPRMGRMWPPSCGILALGLG